MRRTTAKRYADKATTRKSVWDALTQKRVARFPFPVHGRIPNFDGTKQAAQRLLAHPVFRGVRVIKVNPDSPQRWGRRTRTLRTSWRRRPPRAGLPTP